LIDKDGKQEQSMLDDHGYNADDKDENDTSLEKKLFDQVYDYINP
jgi:hypothetical protein